MSVEEATKLINETQSVFNLCNPKSLVIHRGNASIIKKILNSPEFFVREVIQNANDSCQDVENGNVIIKLDGNKVCIFNNGHVFSKKEFEALSSNGISSKVLGGFIGHFGIGFKSIFYYTNEVILHSGFLRWKYDSETLCIPYKLNEKSEFFNGTKVEFDIKLNTENYNYQTDFIKRLESFPHESIIFLKNIRKIVFDCSTFYEEIIVTKRRTLEENLEIINVKSNKNPNDEIYLMLNEKIILKDNLKNHFIDNKITQEELAEKYKKENKEVTLDLFFILPILDEKTFQINCENSGLFFVGLPTDEETNLPLHIHSNFILTPDRKGLIKNDPVNKEILNESINILEKLINFYKKRDGVLTKTEIYKFLHFYKEIYGDYSEISDDFSEDCIKGFKYNFLKRFMKEDNFLVDKNIHPDENFIKLDNIIEVDELLEEYANKNALRNHICRKNLGYFLDDCARKKIPIWIKFNQYSFYDVLIELQKEASLEQNLEKLYKFYEVLVRFWLKYSLIEDKKYSISEIKIQIEKAKIFLLNNNNFVSLEEIKDKKIFYVKGKLPDFAKPILKDINILNLNFIKYLEEKTKKNNIKMFNLIFSFFEEFLTHLSTDEIQKLYGIKFKNIENMNNEEVKEFFVNILDLFKQTRRTIVELKFLVFQINSKENRWISPQENEIYFPHSILKEYNLEILLRFSDNIYFISDEFINLLATEIDPKKITEDIFTDFIVKHGVKNKIELFEQCKNKFPKNILNDDINIIESAREEIKKYNDENRIIIDETFFHKHQFFPFRGASPSKYSEHLLISRYQSGYVFAIIDKVLKYQNEIQNELKKSDQVYVTNFFRMINLNWNYYKGYKQKILAYGVRTGQYYQSNYTEIDFSIFGKMLKEYPWLCNQQGIPQTAKELFIENETTKDLNKYFLLSNVFQNEIDEDLIKFLNLDRSPDITLLLETISSYKTKEIGDFKEIMNDINEKFWNIYLEVKNNSEDKTKVRDFFKNNQIPIINKNKIEFVDIDRLLWSSQIPKKYFQQTIGKTYYILNESGYEDNLKKFFIDVIEIKQELTPQQIIFYYQDLTKKLSISDVERDFILYLYEEAGKYDILNYLIDSCDLLNLNYNFSSNIKYISSSPDINNNLLPNFKDKTLAIPKNMYKYSQDKIKSKDSLYSKWEQMNWEFLNPPLVKEKIIIEGV